MFPMTRFILHSALAVRRCWHRSAAGGRGCITSTPERRNVGALGQR